MAARKKVRTRKQKILMRTVISLLLAALVFGYYYARTLHTPEEALRAAEAIAGVGQTQVIHQQTWEDRTFSLSKNEDILLVSYFVHLWMPKEKATPALVLDLSDGEPVSMGSVAYADPETGQSFALYAGRFYLEENVFTVRARDLDDDHIMEAEIIRTEDGETYFWFWQEGDAMYDWSQGERHPTHTLRVFEELVFLGLDGSPVYTMDFPAAFSTILV